jgi:hypothetical protein
MEMLVQRLREAPNPLAGCLLILDLAGCTASKFLSLSTQFVFPFLAIGIHCVAIFAMVL